LDKLGAARAAWKALGLKARRQVKENASVAKSGNKEHGKPCFNGSPMPYPSQYFIELHFAE